jgi:hypothetical protein
MNQDNAVLELLSFQSDKIIYYARKNENILLQSIKLESN